MKKLNKKGFTLIELIVVIAILAILAAILIPSITGYITKANDARDKANCRSLYSQLSLAVLLDQAAPFASEVEVSGVTPEYTIDEVNNAVTAFSCEGTSKTWTAPDFAD